MIASLVLLYGIVLVPVTRGQSWEFYLIDLNLTWSEAQQYCRENYTDLVTVETEQDLQRIVVPDGKRVWIGLFDDPVSWKGLISTNSNSWRWSATGDKGSSGFTKWRVNQPDFHGAQDTCVFIQSEGWIDDFCNKLFYAACYTVNSTSKEFHFINKTMNWIEARDYCRMNYHDLAVIENGAEFEKVVQWTQPTWIGLHRVPWRWSDGGKSSFRNWKSNEPNNHVEQHCVSVGSDLKWTDDRCELQKPFICYKALKARRLHIQLKLQSSADLSDPTINSQILEAIKRKLGANGSEFKIKWVKVPKRS